MAMQAARRWRWGPGYMHYEYGRQKIQSQICVTGTEVKAVTNIQVALPLQ